MDESVLFQEKIKDILNRNKQEKWYTILTKINTMQFLIAMLAFCACIIIHVVYTKGIEQEGTFSPLLFDLYIIFGAIFCFFGYILSKCRNYLLPIIAYKIGEQIKEIEKGRDLFNKIFWGIIVAFVVSFVVAIIS